MTTTIVPMLVILAIVILLMILGLVLWQKNVREQIKSLQNMERQLAELQTIMKAERQNDDELKSLKVDSLGSIQQTENAEETKVINIQPVQELEFLEKEGFESGKQVQQDENEEDVGRQPQPLIYNIGKSGKHYSEKELELLIKE